VRCLFDTEKECPVREKFLVPAEVLANFCIACNIREVWRVISLESLRKVLG